MAPKISEAECFALLGNRRRRLLIQILHDSNTPLQIIELANRIAECESGDAPPTESESIKIALYHNHLPRLEEAHVTEYNVDEGTVRPLVNFRIVYQYLENVRDADLPWADN